MIGPVRVRSESHQLRTLEEGWHVPSVPHEDPFATCAARPDVEMGSPINGFKGNLKLKRWTAKKLEAVVVVVVVEQQ